MGASLSVGGFFTQRAKTNTILRQASSHGFRTGLASSHFLGELESRGPSAHRSHSVFYSSSQGGFWQVYESSGIHSYIDCCCKELLSAMLLAGMIGGFHFMCILCCIPLLSASLPVNQNCSPTFEAFAVANLTKSVSCIQ